MTSKACKRSRHDSLTIAVPFVVLAVMASNWQVSLLFWMVALCMSGTFLAPAVAVVQAYAPTRLATVFASIYLLANNLVRAGQGLLYVATVSDKAEEGMGGVALSYGMLAIALVIVVGVFGQMLCPRHFSPHSGKSKAMISCHSSWSVRRTKLLKDV